MREQRVLPKEFEFYFPDLDNMVLVQCADDGSVTIRCTKSNFSEKRKIFFIRQLATEGFIPDDYQWFSGSTIGTLGIKWVKDRSWVKIPAAVIRRSGRFMKLMLAGACILWLAMMRVVIVSVQHPSATAPAKTPSALALSTRFDALVEKPGPSYLLPDNR